jgi:hypothetical protein
MQYINPVYDLTEAIYGVMVAADPRTPAVTPTNPLSLSKRHRCDVHP